MRFFVARPEGFEPPAFRIGICCDIQLRHGRIIAQINYRAEAIIPYYIPNSNRFLRFYYLKINQEILRFNLIT